MKFRYKGSIVTIQADNEVRLSAEEEIINIVNNLSPEETIGPFSGYRFRYGTALVPSIETEMLLCYVVYRRSLLTRLVRSCMPV